MTTPQEDISGLSFEEAFALLQDVVARLESGELTLEDSVGLYERGRRLASHCQALLDAAELRVQQLG